jgi:type I restriction enzyme R subunit
MFNEATVVEAFILERMTNIGWMYTFGPLLVRQTTDSIVETDLSAALIRLNPEIAADPSRADEVIYKLRAVIQGVIGDGLVAANEKFMSWVRGDQTLPFGPNGEHVTIRLVDFDIVSNNSFVVSNQVTFNLGPEKRFDVVGFVNGLPLVFGEAKSPVRPSVTWVDGAAQVHDDYEVNANISSFRTYSRLLRKAKNTGMGLFECLWRCGHHGVRVEVLLPVSRK